MHGRQQKKSDIAPGHRAVIRRGARKVHWVSPLALAAIHAEQKKRAWTDAQMAHALGIARAHWTAARNRKRNLPYVAICQAHHLGVPCEALLHVSDE
jgi:hypothetical protein